MTFLLSAIFCSLCLSISTELFAILETELYSIFLLIGLLYGLYFFGDIWWTCIATCGLTDSLF